MKLYPLLLLFNAATIGVNGAFLRTSFEEDVMELEGKNDACSNVKMWHRNSQNSCSGTLKYNVKRTVWSQPGNPNCMPNYSGWNTSAKSIYCSSKGFHFNVYNGQKCQGKVIEKVLIKPNQCYVPSSKEAYTIKATCNMSGPCKNDSDSLDEVDVEDEITIETEVQATASTDNFYVTTDAEVSSDSEEIADFEIQKEEAMETDEFGANHPTTKFYIVNKNNKKEKLNAQIQCSNDYGLSYKQYTASVPFNKKVFICQTNYSFVYVRGTTKSCGYYPKSCDRGSSFGGKCYFKDQVTPKNGSHTYTATGCPSK